jgi:hypothetical protein
MQVSMSTLSLFLLRNQAIAVGCRGNGEKKDFESATSYEKHLR